MFFYFAVLCEQPFPFCVQLFVFGFEGVQVGEFLHPGVLERFSRSFVQNKLAFMLPIEYVLVFGLPQFQRHGPQLLVGGDMLYQQGHIPKAMLHRFQGIGGFVVGCTDLVQSAFQALIALNLVFRQEI